MKRIGWHYWRFNIWIMLKQSIDGWLMQMLRAERYVDFGVNFVLQTRLNNRV